MALGQEKMRLKGMLLAGVMLSVSAYFSWKELRYVAWGGETDARLVRVYQTTGGGRRGRTRDVLTVEYEFKDGTGQTRRESDKISMSDERSAGRTVKVQYLDASPNDSRLHDHTQRFWFIMFFGTIGFLAYNFIRVGPAYN